MTRWAMVKKLGTAASKALGVPIANGLEKAKHRLRNVDVEKRTTQAFVLSMNALGTLSLASLIWHLGAGDRGIEAGTRQLDRNRDRDRDRDIRAKERRREMEEIKALMGGIEELKREFRELLWELEARRLGEELARTGSGFGVSNRTKIGTLRGFYQNHVV